jgi:hypothetical protein
MLMVRLFAVAVVCTFPAMASAQAWADAYRAGNYEKAAEFLHQVVVESTQDLASAHPDPYRHLAVMYADGSGVPKDPIAACTLAQMSGSATMMWAPKLFGADPRAYDAGIKASEEFVRSQCESLTHDDRLAASRSMGCFAFGMREQTVTVAGQAVRIGRRGIALAEADAEPSPLSNCPQIVARVRATSVAPPSDAVAGVTARHFIEIFSWLGGVNKEGQPTYFLEWNVYEVRGRRILFFIGAHLMTLATWPGLALPADIEKGFTFEMIRTGDVRWKLEGAPPKRGWLMLNGGVMR